MLTVELFYASAKLSPKIESFFLSLFSGSASSSRIFMADAMLSSVLALLLISSCTHRVESSAEEEGFIWVEISNKGLDFAKNIFINTAESSLVPLELPDIEKSVDISVLGTVDMILSDITINAIQVTSSTVSTADSGVILTVYGATANLSMNWKYSYSTWLLVPIQVSDSGQASVQVSGMEIGLTLSLKNQQGSLSLSLVKNKCSVKDISINLEGGASWLYQGVVDAFEGKLTSAVEDAISSKINEEVAKLDSLLQSLPKEVPITSIATLNVTFVGDPVINKSSIALAINGLVSARDEDEDEDEDDTLFQNHHRALYNLIPSKGPDYMFTIFLHEIVIKSVLSVYYKAGKMHWIVDEVPDQFLLNTARWKFIVPNLYKQYPNDNMNLNISISSVPNIEIKEQQIDVTVTADVIINVLNDTEAVPVACISVEITGSAFPEISSKDVTGSITLHELAMSLVWSKVGDLNIPAIESIVLNVLRTGVLPYVNSRLGQGFSVPAFYGYTLQNTEILCSDSWIMVSSDVAPTNLDSGSIRTTTFS
ncbi:PREDICTED: putative BPI/LBP family protein At1g04970 [Ipomoea nil]|uniref:putative BPI/LBP family protein At1g04970 n=1 Tax=Ipomoea nil TaxID=35883 RepID=UPI0009016D84|nr:PREDICTED: putative BPI/LBP family protein At1g04970 [Ipomoea nil]